MLCCPLRMCFWKDWSLKMLFHWFTPHHQTDFINPSLFEEDDDDDTEDGTTEKRGTNAPTRRLILRTWSQGCTRWGFKEGDLLQKAGTSSRWQLLHPPCHIYCPCILVSAHIPSSAQKKWFASQTISSISPSWLTTVSRAGSSRISSGMPNPRTRSSRELVLSLCNPAQIRDLIIQVIFAHICDVQATSTSHLY